MQRTSKNKVNSIKHYNCGYCVNHMKYIVKKPSVKKRNFYAGVFLIKHKKYGNILYDTGYSKEIYNCGLVGKIYNLLNPTFIKECETIVYIPISSGLSSSCATATAFALEDDYEGKVFVVDNGRVATPLHQTILDAIDLINIGKTAKEVKEILERMRDKMSIYIVVDDLEYLKRGGRINATTATLGTILNVKPILRFDVGILDQYKKCRGVKAAKKAMLEAMKDELETKFKEYYDKGQVRLLAASSAGKEETDEWVNEIREAFGGVEVLCDDLSMGVSCHIGPGGLGIGCSCRPDELHG